MSRFRFPFDPTAPADHDDVRLAELQAIAQDDTRRPRPQQISRRTRRGHALRHALRPKALRLH